MPLAYIGASVRGAMSKAFTKDDQSTEEIVARAPPRLAPGEQRLVTRDGYEAMQREVARLAEERARVLAEAPPVEREARVQDLDRRAQLLVATMATLTVPPEPTEPAPEGRASFGAWVTVADEAGKQTTYRIVGPDEADAARGRISVESPLARALLGRTEGETVVFERPRGEVELTVVSVRHGA